MADKQQKRKEYMSTYRERNSKKIKAQNRLHYAENRETILEQRRRNHAENREAINGRIYNRRQRTSERHFKSAIFGSPNFLYPIAHDLGPLNIECEHCKAVHFKDELKSMCSHNGKLSHLSIQNGPENFPIALKNLFIGTDAKSQNFREFIRRYNNANAFASMGANVVDISGNGPYCFKISGEVYYRTSENIQIDTTLDPISVHKLNNQSSYIELYVYDTDTSIEIPMANPANA
ncbi:unnamed protein product [Rotaria sp. Silwood2]|nr:unnamed protein product [Rotaria sp. Silwood2]